MSSLVRKAVVRIHDQVYAASIVRFWSLLLNCEKWMEVAVCADSGADVLVTNRCEGNAPLTVQALVEMLQG